MQYKSSFLIKKNVTICNKKAHRKGVENDGANVNIPYIGPPVNIT